MLYHVHVWGENYKLRLLKTEYCDNGTLAVIAVTDIGEAFCDVTRNIDTPGAAANQAFVDVNNCPWMPEFLEKNGIATPTGVMGQSGFCLYPLYKFDLSKLEEL